MSRLSIPTTVLAYLEYLPRHSVGILLVQALSMEDDNAGDPEAWQAKFADEVPLWLSDCDPRLEKFFEMTFSLRPAVRGGWEVYVKTFKFKTSLR